MGRVHLCGDISVLGYALKWYSWSCLVGVTLGTGGNLAGPLDFSPTPTHDNSRTRNLMLKIDLASMNTVFPGVREWSEWSPSQPGHVERAPPAPKETGPYRKGAHHIACLEVMAGSPVVSEAWPHF